MSCIEDLPDDPELAFKELAGRYSETPSEAVGGRAYYSDNYSDCMEYLVNVTSAEKVVCPHLVARFKSNALWAFRPSLMARPARAVLAAPAACSRGSSAGVAYCSAGDSAR